MIVVKRILETYCVFFGTTVWGMCFIGWFLGIVTGHVSLGLSKMGWVTSAILAAIITSVYDFRRHRRGTSS